MQTPAAKTKLTVNRVNKPFWAILFILTAGACFRLFNLAEQGLFHWDEGMMVLQGAFLNHALFYAKGVSYLPADLVYAKPLWIFFLSIAQQFISTPTLAGQLISVIFGLCTIGAVFAVTKKDHSFSLAFWAAACLAFSSNHIFYSRLVLPEAAAAFFIFLSVVTYWRGSINDKLPVLIFTGMFLMFSILLNYRSIMAVTFILIVEIFIRHSRERLKSKYFQRLLMVLSGLLITFLGFLTVVYLLKQAHIHIPDYFDSLRASANKHQIILDGFSFFTFPLILVRYDFILLCGFVILLFFWNKTTLFVRFCWICVVAQLFLGSLPDEKCFRTVMLIYPFFTIAAAAGLMEVFLLIKRMGKIFTGIFIVLLIINAFFNAKPVLAYKSDWTRAVRETYAKYPHASILMTNGFIMAALPPEGYLISVPPNASVETLRRFYNDGYRILITDPEKFYSTTKSGAWGETELNEMISAVDKHCHPQTTYKHFNRHLFQRMALDGVRPSLRKTLTFLSQTDEQSGEIAVYDIERCLSNIEN